MKESILISKAGLGGGFRVGKKPRFKRNTKVYIIVNGKRVRVRRDDPRLSEALRIQLKEES